MYALIAIMCGGGGFDLGGIGAGGGAEAKCTNESGVNGHGECRSYGRWRANRRAIIEEVSTITSLVDVSGIEATGEMDHDDARDYRYRVVSDDVNDGEPAVAYGLAIRLLYPGRVMYGGLETSLAVVSGAEGAPVTDAATGALMTPSIAGMVTATGVLGSRSFREPFGRDLPLSFGAEVSAGVRAIALTVDSRSGSCVTEDTTLHLRPMVEARGRADLWITPRVSLGAYAGADVLTGMPTGGLTFAMHRRGFDGVR